MGKAVGPGQFTKYEAPLQPLSLFEQRLPISDGQLHILTCAGVGDNLWVVSKFWSVAQERDVTFWLPAQEQRRSGDLFRMMGLRYGYMPGLTTNWIWSRPGEPPIPATGAVLSIQPNRHLEHGHRIEKWYPSLEFRNPVEFLDIGAAVYQREAKRSKYVVGFMSQLEYMEYGGNLKPAQWARIWRKIEKDVGPVLLIGAGKDVEFADEVMRFFSPTIEPMFNEGLDQVASAMAGAEMVVGSHAGPLILSTYLNVPTLHSYPRWLSPMPGTWEAPGNVWGSCFLDELELVVNEGIRFQGNRLLGCADDPWNPTIRIYGDLHPRWSGKRRPECTTTARSNGAADDAAATTSSTELPMPMAH